MIARIWRTGLDEKRAEEYDAFALERSLPMFRRQPGFRAVFFVRTATGRAAISLWKDRASAEALTVSADYLSTVEAIRASGLLRPPQTVELLPVDSAWLAPDLV
jgi:heme-degrading monooxygenase HmoA